MAIQSREEQMRVCVEWAEHNRPSNLVTEGEAGSKNAALITDQCFKDQGIISISGLTRAAQTLAAQGLLALKPKTVELSAQQKDELAAQQQMDRQRRDYIDSIKPQESFEDKINAEQARKAKELAAKNVANAEHDIKMTIDGYQCYGVGRVDFLATEQVQKELYAVALYKDGKRDPIGTLVEVKRIIAELPDHPKLGDVKKTAERFREERAHAAESKQAQPRQQSTVRLAHRFRFPS